IDHKSRPAAVYFFYMLFLDVIDLGLFASPVFGIIGCQTPGFLKGTVRNLVAAAFQDHMGTRYTFCVEPPVISRGEVECQFFILKIILSYIHMIAVTGDIVKRTA